MSRGRGAGSGQKRGGGGGGVFRGGVQRNRRPAPYQRVRLDLILDFLRAYLIVSSEIELD
jgi:hypothetical protein